MKLIYKPLTDKYMVSGTKIVKEGNRTAESCIEIRIKPRAASIFTDFQKVRFTRIINMDSNENTFDSFVKDSANTLNHFELELTSKGEPCHVVNYQDIWKKWMSESDLLNSKYTGDWVKKELELMTTAIGDKSKLFAALLQDFCMNEIYNRNIFTIAFDNKTCSGKREWTETALDGIPVLFIQEYRLKDSSKEDRLTIEGNAPYKRKYIYHDKQGNEHQIGTFNLTLTPKVIRSNKSRTVKDIAAHLQADSNGDIELIDIKQFTGYASGNIKAKFGLWDSEQYKRYYINPDCMAGLLGAMLDMNIDYLVFSGSSQKDGTPEPSVSHVNGIATDLGYLRTDKKAIGVILQDKNFDLDTTRAFVEACFDYGYRTLSKMGTEKFKPCEKTDNIFIIEGMGNFKTPPHNNHLHLDGFDFTTVKIINK